MAPHRDQDRADDAPSRDLPQLPHHAQPQRAPRLRAAHTQRAGRRQGELHVPSQHGEHAH